QVEHRCNCYLADSLLMQLHDFIIPTFALLSSCLLLGACFRERLLRAFFFTGLLTLGSWQRTVLCRLLLSSNAFEALMFALKEADHGRLKVHKQMEAIGNLPRLG